MAIIIILDDSRANSAFLKMRLMRHRHRVSRTALVQDVTDPPSGFLPDLVLINHAFRNDSGWEVFNYLKQIAPQIPAMVYMLEPLSTASAAWIIKAVQEAMGETKKNAAKRPDSSLNRTMFVDGKRWPLKMA